MQEGRIAYEDELLTRYAVYVSHRDRYRLSGDASGINTAWMSRAQALDVIRVHMGLGLEPTGTVDMSLLVALYDRVVALEQGSLKISG